jgi:hypothetical protein
VLEAVRSFAEALGGATYRFDFRHVKNLHAFV